MAIAFDGPNLRIILDSGVTTLDIEDLYSRWKDFAKTGTNAKFPFAFDDSFGGNTIKAGLDAGPYFTLRNDLGWRLRPPEEDINILVTGNLIPADDTLDMVVPTLGAFTVLLQGLQPITQVVQSGVSGLTAAESTQLFGLPSDTEIATAVWAAIAEGTLSFAAFMRIMGGALAGKTSGFDVAAPVHRNISDSKDVITATTDLTGRTAVTVDGS